MTRSIPAPKAPRTALLGDRILWGLLLLALLRLWLMPLPSGFWVDESATAFVVRHTGAHPSFAAAPQVPASLYYLLPAAVHRLAGFSEVLYRLPSTLALAAALAAYWALARRLLPRGAHWLALFALLSLRGFNYQAADARPYALGTALAALSLLSLLRFLESGRHRDAALFTLAAALLWPTHLIFWPFYLVYPAALWRRATPASLRRLAPYLLLLALALLPTLLQALSLFRQASNHVIVDLPRPGELFHQLHLSAIAGLLAASALLARVFRWRRGPAPAPESLALLLAWWLAQPLALFAVSWLSGHSLFVPRYLALSLPGAALTMTAALCLYLPPRLFRPAAAAFGLAVLLLLGQWSRLWPEHHPSGWRAAAALLNAQPGAPRHPVLCPSPFIEARPPFWAPAAARPSFLYSHLDTYPLSGPQVLLPFDLPDPLPLDPAWLQTGRFSLYGGDRIVRLWRSALAARPELQAWHSSALGRFGDVEIVVFELSSPPSGLTPTPPLSPKLQN